MAIFSNRSKLKVYLVGQERIVAERFERMGSTGIGPINFFIGRDLVASFNDFESKSVILEDVIVDQKSFSELGRKQSGKESISDVFGTSYPNDNDKTEFGLEERRRLKDEVRSTYTSILRTYGPSPEASEDIYTKMDYLERKVDELSKFDWKRLVVITIIGVAIDLGFGTKIPSSLQDLFKELLAEGVKLVAKKGRGLLPSWKN